MSFPSQGIYTDSEHSGNSGGLQESGLGCQGPGTARDCSTKTWHLFLLIDIFSPVSICLFSKKFALLMLRFIPGYSCSRYVKKGFSMSFSVRISQQILAMKCQQMLRQPSRLNVVAVIDTPAQVAYTSTDLSVRRSGHAWDKQLALKADSSTDKLRRAEVLSLLLARLGSVRGSTEAHRNALQGTLGVCVQGSNAANFH
ncbi:hypothetical protein RRG08_003644 [Elysia crispata]|uniref:Uncharacterized protein n=1 Tax=Elysia crispata TaxID=231223 RepID=A0AAE1E575_9GAST|nr:hypothetical protein RRG08_003644 [Elysia crispata]